MCSLALTTRSQLHLLFLFLRPVLKFPPEPFFPLLTQLFFCIFSCSVSFVFSCFLYHFCFTYPYFLFESLHDLFFFFLILSMFILSFLVLSVLTHILTSTSSLLYPLTSLFIFTHILTHSYSHPYILTDPYSHSYIKPGLSSLTSLLILTLPYSHPYIKHALY